MSFMNKMRGWGRKSDASGDADDSDGTTWLHASLALTDRSPTYDELVILHRAVFGRRRWAYQIFAPEAAHVNLHAYALHLWGRVDGKPAMPNFGASGSI